MKVTLHHLKIDEIEWARELHNDPEVRRMLTDPHIVTADEQVLWYEKLLKSTTSERLVAKLGEEKIGVVRLDQIDYNNKSICVGLDIYKSFRGKGYARPIYKKVLKEWFDYEGFNRVWLMVAGYNSRAKHLYTSLGFVEEGVQREALFKDGKFYDYIIMSILQKEYKERYVNEDTPI